MIGRRIKELRKKLGLTQREFARRVGVIESLVRKWERGENDPTSKSLQAIAKEFNVNLHWLLTGEGEMFITRSKEEIPKTELLDREIIQKIFEVLEGFYQQGLLKDVPEEELMEVVKFVYKRVKPLKEKEEQKWAEELQELTSNYVRIFFD
ncbi:MAG: helix-turn-helix transcriptional regulator [Desulfurobacteriaceae bacterium]